MTSNTSLPGYVTNTLSEGTASEGILHELWNRTSQVGGREMPEHLFFTILDQQRDATRSFPEKCIHHCLWRLTNGRWKVDTARGGDESQLQTQRGLILMRSILHLMEF